METSELDEYAYFAHQLLDCCLPVLRKNYEELVASAKNSDTSLLWKKKQKDEIVTAGEIQAESLMREMVASKYPNHDIAGEELGYSLTGSGYLWVFDPIDGTAAMIESAISTAKNQSTSETNKPFFGITIGLLYQNKPIIGLVYDFINHKKFFGVAGNNSHQIRKSDKLITDATLCSTAPNIMFHSEKQKSSFNATSKLTKKLYTNRNCIGFMQLITGEVDIVWEGDLAFHDIVALIPILENAGIKVTDEAGENFDFSAKNHNKEYRVIAAFPELHQQVIQIIAKSDENEINPSKLAINPYYNKKF